MSGEEFRQWRANLYDEASGFTDESASSLADYFDECPAPVLGPPSRGSAHGRLLRQPACELEAVETSCRDTIRKILLT